MYWAISIGFVTGLLGSFHCLGMCGPLVFSLPIGKYSTSKKILVQVIYHFSRAIGYATIGFVLGIFGEALNLFGFQKYFSILIGILLVVSVLFKFRPKNNFIVKYQIALNKRIASFIKKRSYFAFASMGFFNALLPCGLSYVAFMTALALPTGIDSALFLAFFGFGTSLLFLISYFGLGKIFNFSINKIIPYYSLILGILLILRGSNLDIPYLSPSNLNYILGAPPITECH